MRTTSINTKKLQVIPVQQEQLKNISKYFTKVKVLEFIFVDKTIKFTVIVQIIITEDATKYEMPTFSKVIQIFFSH